MASTSATVFTTNPMLGVDLDSKSSSQLFAPLTAVIANDGRKHIYLTAQGTLGSTANVTAGASGSATAAASAGVAQSFNVNTSGGVVVGQKFWAKSNSI